MAIQTYDNIATRYRPHVLSDMIGQSKIVSQLKGMFKSERITRTLLISGPWGSGKTTSARIIARYINCKVRKPEEDPCDQCESCKELSKPNPSHSDYQELNAADARGIDTVRSIIDQAKFKPKTNYRVFVLDEVHQLTPQAFQALLKILEEPPPQSLFILCTTEPHKIPPTAVSRATKLPVQSVPPEETAALLRKVADNELKDKSKYLSDDNLLTIAEAVKGHPRDALTAIESIINAIFAMGKLENVDEYVSKVIEESVANPLDRQVRDYLVSIYNGKYVVAIKTLKGVDNHQAFLDVILKYHVQTTYATVSAKLKDKYFNSWYNELEESKILTDTIRPNPLMLSEAMNHFMKAASDLKAYLVDSYYVLFNATVQAIAARKNFPPLEIEKKQSSETENKK